MHDIEFEPSALEDLKSLRKSEQQRVLDGEAIGFKIGNLLFIRNERREL